MSKGSSDRNRIQLDIPSWIEDGRKKERNMEIRIGDGMTDLTPDAETPDPVRPEEGKTDIVLPDAPADSVKPPAQTEQAESTGSAESAGDRGGLAVKTRKLQAAAGRMAARAADWTREDVGSWTWQKNVLLAAISRYGSLTIPNGDSSFEEGDTLLIVTASNTVTERLNDIFE